MIYSPNIFQPKLCAIDFSVDSNRISGYTKFAKEDSLTLQISIFTDFYRKFTENQIVYRYRSIFANTLEQDKVIDEELVLRLNLEGFANPFLLTPLDYVNVTPAYISVRDTLLNNQVLSAIVSWGNNPTNSIVTISYTGQEGKLTPDILYGLGFGLINEENYAARAIEPYAFFDSDLTNEEKQALFGSSDISLTFEGFSNIYTDLLVDNYVNERQLTYGCLNELGILRLNGVFSVAGFEAALSEDYEIIGKYTHLRTNISLKTLDSGGYRFLLNLCPLGEDTFTMNNIVADSECIEILDSADNTILFNFQHYKTLFGCIFDGETNYMFRVTGDRDIQENELAVSSSEFSTYDNRNIKTSGYLKNVYTLIIGSIKGLPIETIDKLMLALQCKNIIINGEEALISAGQDKLDVLLQFNNGNVSFKLKIQPAKTKLVSSSAKQMIGVKGKTLMLNGKYS